MKSKISALCAVTALGLLSINNIYSADAAPSEKERATALLAASNKALAEASTFYSEQTSENVNSQLGMKITIKMVTKLYKKKMPDGIVITRVESTGTGSTQGKKETPSNTFVTITNEEGEWELIGKTAILRADMMDKEKKLKAAAASVPHGDFNADSQFAVAEKQMGDKNFYVVTETFSEEKRNFGDKLADQLQTKPSPPDKKPAIRETWISKDDGLAYKDIVYAVNGDVLKSEQYSIIKINLPLEDDLFVIPGTYKKKVVNNADEYKQVMTSAFFNPGK